METYHLEKRRVLPGSFNFHNLCYFVGCWGPIYPLALMIHWYCLELLYTVPKEKYLMSKEWDNLVSNLWKVVSGCVLDVVRHLFLVSRWFNLTTGQTGHISEGLHAMLEVADKKFLKSIFLAMPQVHRSLLNCSFFPLIPGDPTSLVILFSWIRMSVKQKEGRWLVPVWSCCNTKLVQLLVQQVWWERWG